MKYSKPHLPYEDQLDLLIRRGLACSDRAGTLYWLKRIGYYRLSAYFIPFKDPATGNFRLGTAFEQIIDLYRFDADLRRLVREALDRIEISVRAVITYEIGKDLGVFGYADRANFAATFNHADFMKILRREEGRSTEVFIGHYRAKYTSETDLPVWMATELISFGALSKMYEHLRTSFRKKIAREFNQPQPVFVSWLHALTAVRNVCAHHSRLWNRELAVKPELPVAWKANGIGNDRFYVIALIIQTLLTDISPDSRWGERLKALFKSPSGGQSASNAVSRQLANSLTLDLTAPASGLPLPYCNSRPFSCGVVRPSLMMAVGEFRPPATLWCENARPRPSAPKTDQTVYGNLLKPGENKCF